MSSLFLDLPPQTPLSWLESRAYSKHSTCDGHLEQTFLAKEIASNALPVLPIGKKALGWCLYKALILASPFAGHNKVLFELPQALRKALSDSKRSLLNDLF